LVRVFLWVPCWTNLRLIKVILVACTLTYLPSLEVASTLTYLPSLEVASTLTYLPSLEVASSKNLCYLYQVIRSYSGSHHLVSELHLLIQVLSYPIIFLCNFSKFVFCPCFVICFLVCFLLRSCLCLHFVLVLVLVMFLFLFLFLVSFRLWVKKNLFEFCFK